MTTTAGTPAPLRTSDQDPSSSWLFHHVRVARLTPLGASFVRVTLAGPSLARSVDTGWDQRIKLLLPVEGHGVVELPMVDDWYARWLAMADDQRNPLRTYTLRQARPQACEVDVDVVRHGRIGPAGRWIEDVAVGDDLVVMLPNGPGPHGGIDFHAPEGCRRVLLGGDATAAPAIAGILTRLPADVTGVAVVELPDPADAAVLPAHPGVRVEVVAADGAPGAALCTAFADAARDFGRIGTDAAGEVEDVDVDADILWDVPEPESGDAYAWIAGEAAAIKELRRLLVGELGWDRKAVAFMGYWRIGRSESD